MADYPPGFDAWKTPARPPPPGVIPNFTNPPSLSWMGRVAVYITLPVMIVILALRVYTRTRIVKQFGIDDYITVIAGVFTISFSVTLLTQFLDETYGRHLWDIPIAKATPAYLKRLLATGILYNFGAMFCKLALLTFYFRIFRPSQISRLVCWCGIALTVVFYTTTSVINLVYCLPRPSDGGWNSPASLTRCDAHQQKLNFAQGIVSSITDFYVLAIPFTMIASLNLSMRRKIGLLGVFLTGLTAAIFSILGTVYRHKAAASVPSDASWYGLTVQALGVAELNLGIICACLPILITLFKRFSETLSAAWKSISTRISSSAGNRGLASAEIANTSPHVTGKVPRGTIEGLSSFIRSFRVPNTQPSEKSFNVDSITDNNTYVELHSLDYEYHAHIEHPGKQTKQRL